MILSSPVKLGAALVAALSVSSCGPLISFGEDGPPETVFSLQYDGDMPQPTPTGPTVYVDSPRLIAGLDGQGISVRLAGNERASLSGARWAGHLGDLIRDYVELSLAANSDASMVSEGGLDIKAGCRLGTKVWKMDYVPGADIASDEVQVSLQFSLVRLSDSKLLSHPTFNKTAPVANSSSQAVAAAFDTALAAAAREYSGWFADESKGCRS